MAVEQGVMPSWPAPVMAPERRWTVLARTVGVAVLAVFAAGGLAGGWAYLIFH